MNYDYLDSIDSVASYLSYCVKRVCRIFIKEDNREARLQQERYEQEKKIDEVFESIKSEIK